jgi:phosphohistidine phosphatase
MLTLLLLRHAKSDWDDAKLTDFDRPLSKRGRRDAPRMGTFMADHAPPINHVLCSGAVRTLETWALAASQLNSPPERQILRELYLAEPEALLACIQHAPTTCKTLLVVGHNPGLHELAMSLCGAKSAATLSKALTRKFPTAALAVFNFRAKSWSTVKVGTGLLVDFRTPKSLNSDS